MFPKGKRLCLILILFAIVSSIEVLLLLYFPFSHGYFGKLLFGIRLTRWGWVPAIVLGNTVFTLLIRWKIGKPTLYFFILAFSIIEVIFALLWAYLALVAMSFKEI